MIMMITKVIGVNEWAKTGDKGKPQPDGFTPEGGLVSIIIIILILIVGMMMMTMPIVILILICPGRGALHGGHRWKVARPLLP